ncbi:hypothetical protein Amsp01_009530 [Amycolatopsis sp. NBRC 101858]|nr:hypothetical protein Amsp01_009530 [Amycolatopsis sp. NBRC 101858]
MAPEPAQHHWLRSWDCIVIRVWKVDGTPGAAPAVAGATRHNIRHTANVACTRLDFTSTDGLLLERGRTSGGHNGEQPGHKEQERHPEERTVPGHSRNAEQ